MDATLTGPRLERQLIEPFLLSSPGENPRMKGATNEGP